MALKSSSPINLSALRQDYSMLPKIAAVKAQSSKQFLNAVSSGLEKRKERIEKKELNEAAKKMIEKKSGIIFNLSYWASQRNDRGVAYCTSKAATDKMTDAMAYELHKFNIPVICLYPGLVRTEAALRAKDHFDLTNSESPEFIGMVISKLVSDSNVIEKTGKVLIAASEAMEYGIKDIDGKQPKPLSLNEV